AHQYAVFRNLQILLDIIRNLLDRNAVRWQGVLRRVSAGAAMTHDKFFPELCGYTPFIKRFHCCCAADHYTKRHSRHGPLEKRPPADLIVAIDHILPRNGRRAGTGDGRWRCLRFSTEDKKYNDGARD